MGHDTMLVLCALLAFQAKHFICDFVLQTQYQVRTKGIYGHTGGLIHAGLHAVLSLPAMFILSASLPAIGIAAFCEFVIHYHVDWSKAALDARWHWSETGRTYWIVFGLDQLVHQITYIAIAYVLIRAAA